MKWIGYLVVAWSLAGPLRSTPQPPVVRLRVESNYAFGAADRVKGFLEAGGFSVTQADPFDAALEVEIQAEPLAQSYSLFGVGPGTRYYTGASVNGTFLLEVKNGPAREKKFSGRVAPPYELKGGSTSPDGAPFWQAIRDSDFFAKLGEAITETFGSEIVIGFSITLLRTQEYRPVVADVLGKIGPAAAPPLIESLRANAVAPELVPKALAKMGDSTALGPFLKDPDAKVRHCVSDALGQIGDAAAILLLAKTLQEDEDLRVRANAAGHLRGRAAAESLPALTALVRALKDPDFGVRQAAVKSLGENRDERAAPALEKALNTDADPYVRFSALEAIAGLDQPRMAAILAALRDQDARVRTRALEVVGEKGDESTRPALEEVLQRDADPEVRAGAIRALFRLKQAQTTTLVAALQDADGRVRTTAAEALGRLEDPKSAGALIAAMQDQPISVRRAILGVLKKLTGQDFGLDAQAWSKWWADQSKL